eukprot:358413-Chlamydomonas_euryale.AAC.1
MRVRVRREANPYPCVCVCERRQRISCETHCPGASAMPLACGCHVPRPPTHVSRTAAPDACVTYRGPRRMCVACSSEH